MRPVAKFKCGHVRRRNNTDKRGGCRKCAGAGLRALHEKRRGPRKRKPTVRPMVMTPDRAAKAAEIRRLHAEGLSQRAIAERVGVSQPTVWREVGGMLREQAAPRPVSPSWPTDISYQGRAYALFPPKQRSA